MKKSPGGGAQRVDRPFRPFQIAAGDVDQDIRIDFGQYAALGPRPHDHTVAGTNARSLAHGLAPLTRARPTRSNAAARPDGDAEESS